MMVPLNNSCDTYTMTPGLNKEHSASPIESGVWTIPELDSGLSFSLQDSKQANTDTNEWPVKLNKRKAFPVDEISETGNICDLFFHQPAKKLSLLFNTKFRYKEERKRILKLSIAKLRQVDDPEVFLRRSVLINNTVRRLHKELREEKLNHNSRFLNTHSNEAKKEPETPEPKDADKLRCATCLEVNVLKDTCRSSTPGPHKSPSKRPLETSSQQETIKSKQSKVETPSEELVECEVQRFEAPLLLTQPKERRENTGDRGNSGVVISEIEKQYSQYSCGQSSIFGELQSVVFHSLIASLES